MKLLFSFLFCLFIMVGLLAQDDQINPPQPVVNTNFQDFEDKISVINIPITISIKDIEKMINQSYKGVIYRDDSFDNNNNDDLKIKVTKRADIVVATVNEKVKVIIPLHIWAAKQVRQTILGQTIKQSADTDFDVTINYFITLEIKENWELKSETKGSFEWDKKPYISVGGLIDIPLASQIEAPLKDQVDEIAKEINKAVQEAIDLKAIGTEAWKTAQQPMLLDSATNAWLYVRPKSVATTPLLLKYNKASLNLGITTYITNTIGETKQNLAPTKLPKLLITNAVADDFNVALNAFASYENIKAMLAQQFDNQTFTLEDQEVLITETDFIGSAEKVIVKVGIDGRFKKGILKKRLRGALFLEGVPVYDSTSQIISIQNLDYSIATKDLLVKTAKWLSDKKIREMMAQNLVFPVGDQIAQARAMIEKELKSYKINEFATLSGRLKELRPEGIYLLPDRIKVVVLAKGKVSMQVGGF